MKKVFIKSNLPDAKDGSHPLALWEKNENHPEGEIWVAGDVVVEAALTPEVIAAIRNEKVVEVDAKADSKKSAKKTALPKDFPGLDVLAKANVKTYEDLGDLNPEDVKKFDGMTDELLTQIDSAMGEFVKATAKK